MKTHLTTFLACCILAAASAIAAAANAKPNVIIILTDDQGFGEPCATGKPIPLSADLMQICITDPSGHALVVGCLWLKGY